MLLLAALLALAGAQLPARAQSPQAPGLSDLGEGPLDNDVFQPVSTAAQEQLAQGDELLAALLQRTLPDAAERERAWTAIFEHWSAALAAGSAGEAVVVRPWRAVTGLDSPWPDPDGTAGGGADDRPARRTEGLEYALLRRLAGLDEARRAAWTARFEPLAAEAFGAARGQPARLAALEARHPATRAAALAALTLAELEFEAGRAVQAQAWLERGERQARLARADDVAAALALRRSLPRLTAAVAGPLAPEAWATANSLRFLAEVPLEDLSARTHVFLPRPGDHAESGLAWFGDGTALVQTYLQAAVIDAADGRRIALIDPVALLAAAGHPVSLLDPPRAAPGWPALPAVGNGRGVLVLHSEPPAVLCFRLEDAPVFGELRSARLEWARVGAAWIDGQGRALAGPHGAAAWPAGEPQPGPLVIGERVFLCVQDTDPSGAGRRGAWLVALDLESGRVLWNRLIARGMPLVRSELRFMAGAPAPSASQPLARCGARILVGTHLGATALVDALDGRIAWSLATRRRPGESSGWTGARAPIVGPDADILLAPADSDRLYVLRGAPDLEGRGLFLQPPQRLEESVALLGGSRAGAVLFARSGRERNLAELQFASGARWEAPWLAPGETFTGHAAVSSQRALFATQRALYLHDRERELYLAECLPFPREFAGSGGAVYARGERVLVLGPHMAWVLAVR